MFASNAGGFLGRRSTPGPRSPSAAKNSATVAGSAGNALSRTCAHQALKIRQSDWSARQVEGARAGRALRCAACRAALRNAAGSAGRTGIQGARFTHHTRISRDFRSIHGNEKAAPPTKPIPEPRSGWRGSSKGNESSTLASMSESSWVAHSATARSAAAVKLNNC
jgi:hypothetical protein